MGRSSGRSDAGESSPEYRQEVGCLSPSVDSGGLETDEGYLQNRSVPNDFFRVDPFKGLGLVPNDPANDLPTSSVMVYWRTLGEESMILFIGNGVVAVRYRSV